MLNNYAKTDLELMVGSNEKILWQGKPHKRGSILEGIFNPLLPFALIWFLFDSMFIAAYISGLKTALTLSSAALLPILFFALHLMPVWIYLGGALFVFRKY